MSLKFESKICLFHTPTLHITSLSPSRQTKLIFVFRSGLHSASVPSLSPRIQIRPVNLTATTLDQQHAQTLTRKGKHRKQP